MDDRIKVFVHQRLAPNNFYEWRAIVLGQY